MSYDFELDSNQRGLCTDPSSYPSAYGWSVAVWFRPESIVADETFFSCVSPNDGNAICILRVDSTGHLNIYRRGVVGTPITYTSSGTVSTGTWALATYAETSRTSRKLWLNDTEVTTDSTDLLSDWQTNDNMTRIGAACFARRPLDGDVGYFFDGMVAEIAIWPSTVLTQANVDSLYGGGTSGAVASSVAGGPSLWFRFNSDKGSSSYAADTGTGTMTFTGSPVYSVTHAPISAGATTKPAYYYAQL